MVAKLSVRHAARETSGAARSVMSLEPLRGFVRNNRRLYDFLRSPRDAVEYANWVWRGRPLPPPHVAKARRVREYGKRFGTPIRVETGTFKGGMIDVTKRHFERVYSLELDDDFYERAAKRCEGFDHISILHGDSGEVLPRLLEEIDRPCLCWLDGHYSGGKTARGPLDTPIVQEIRAILTHPVEKHVMLIDDARDFVGGNDYPSIDELRRKIHARQPELVFTVEEDIIRVPPPVG